MYTSTIGRIADILVRWVTKLLLYSVWIAVAIWVLLNPKFDPNFANYWSLIVAVLYYLCERFRIARYLTGLVKGKWKSPKSREYHQVQWKFVIINILPIVSLPIASYISNSWTAQFNTNGLTFVAMLITVMTANLEFDFPKSNDKKEQ